MNIDNQIVNYLRIHQEVSVNEYNSYHNNNIQDSIEVAYGEAIHLKNYD
jgi:hypothetical protein